MNKISQIYCQDSNFLKYEGQGWRLAMDPSKGEFCFLLGGDSWAIEITSKEWNNLVPLVIDLTNQHNEYKKYMVSEESIIFELERYQWWGCLNGDKDFWSLKLILNGNEINNRGIEMYWPIQSAQDFVLAMRNMWDSF